MSKYVGSIFNELEESAVINDDFDLFVLSVKVDDSGETYETESIRPIAKIGVDIEHKECRFQTLPGKEALKIPEAYSEIETIDSGLSLVSVLSQTFNDSSVRIDNSVIGFGENIDDKRFFIVCMAQQSIQGHRKRRGKLMRFTLKTISPLRWTLENSWIITFTSESEFSYFCLEFTT